MCIFGRFSVFSGYSARAAYLSVVSGVRNKSGPLSYSCAF